MSKYVIDYFDNDGRFVEVGYCFSDISNHFHIGIIQDILMLI